MDRKLALAALLAVALLCAGLWLLLGRSGGGRGAPTPAARPAEITPAQSAPPAPPAELAAAAAPGAERAAPEPAAPEPSAPLALEHQTFTLESARWVDVAVVLPGGIPADDRPALLAFAPKDGDEVDEWAANRLGEQLDLSDDFAAEVEDEHDWARRPLAPRVRIPFPPESAGGVLLLQSRYLHLEPVRVALPAEEAVTIEPELGGYVTGRCVFAGGRRAASEDVSVEFEGRAGGDGPMVFARSDSRDARVRADLSFELRALSARKKYVVQGKAEGFVGYFELAFEIAPGEHRDVEIPFRPGATLTGIVRGDGQPLAEAEISAQVRGGLPFDDGLSARSGADGTFVLAGVAGGQVTLHASKDGWRDAQERTLEVLEGQTVGGIELELGAGERIGGTVVWPDGKPVQGARVRASKVQQHWVQRLVEVQTASDGSFVLGGLESEPVEVFARHAPRDAHEHEAKQALAPAIEHEGVAVAVNALDDLEWGDDSAEGQWIALEPAVAPGTRELLLRLQEPLPVRGVVVDDDGAAVTSFRIIARPAQRPQNAPEEVNHAFEAEDGRFTLGVGLPGEWIFTAQGSGDQRESEGVTLGVPQGAAELRIVLPRASGVAGVVVDPAGQPVAGASVHVSDSPQEAAFARFGGGGEETGADGRFALEHVPSGSYLHATHADWAASEQLALELAPGETRADLELRLRVGARITGEVFDEQGKPQAGQNVTCAGGAMAAMAFGLGGERSTSADAAGRFAFEHVTPGKVMVTAVPSEEELMQRFQEGADEQAFMALLGSMRSTTVEVADGGEAHVVLGAKPKQPVRVHGRVSEAGAPLADKAVFAFAEGGALLQGMKLGRTDDLGRYELVLDRPGDYVFGVSSSEGMSDAGTQFYVEVPEAAELELDLALPLARVAGVVLGPDGPVAGVTLRLVASEGMLGLDDLSESHRATSGADGSFELLHLEPGSYALQVGADFDAGPGGPRLAQTIVDGIRLERDAAVEGLVVRLAAPGRLTGVVRDAAGQPCGALAIFVRDAAGRAISASSCLTDAAGKFTYEGVTPGRVTASARGGKLVSAESAAVEVRAGETSTVELTATEGTVLVVSLLEEDEPVRARLRVTDEAGRRVDDLLSTEDLMGLLGQGFSTRERRVGPLAPGKYTLVATALDGKDAKKSVLVEAGQSERSVKLRLK